MVKVTKPTKIPEHLVQHSHKGGGLDKEAGGEPDGGKKDAEYDMLTSLLCVLISLSNWLEMPAEP